MPIKRLVWISISLYVLFFGYISFLKYQTFEYIDFDLAIHAQTVWNIIHGSIYSSILGIDFLGNHANFILFLIAPIYFIFRSPLTLLFLQTLFLAFTAYPLYLIAKDEINEKIGLAVVFVYLMYPALGYVNLYEFHPTVFATCFLSFMFYYFRKEDFNKFILFMILALLCQESVPLIIIPFGIYVFFTKRDIKWSLIPLILGIMWFLVTVGKIIPYFNKNTIQFFRIYEHLGKSIEEVLKFVTTHPIALGKIIFTKQKILFMIHLFMPLSFLSLLDLHIFVLSLAFFQHLISYRFTEHTIYYHYTAEMIPFIFITFIYGIKRFLKFFYVKKYFSQKIIISFIIGVAIISNIYLGPQINLIRNIPKFKKDIWDYQKQRFLDIISPEASVVATFEFLPKLSQRGKLYSFHHVSIGFYTLSNIPYQLPEDVEYALLDFNDNLTFNTFYISGRSDVNIRKFISSGQWGVFDMIGNIVLLKKEYKDRYKLYQVLKELPKISGITQASANDELELLGYEGSYENIYKGKQIKLVFYWRALREIKDDYGNFIDIITKNGEIKYRFIKPICYRVLPTYTWHTNEIIKENYNLYVPEDIKNEDYFIRIGIFDYKTKKTYPIFSSIANVIDNNSRIKLDNINFKKR